MCISCRPLIKAIDAYIKKADSDFSDEIAAQGFLEPEKTVKYMQDIEDGVAKALLEETDYILSEAEKAVDLEIFAKDVWPAVKLNDTIRSKLVTVFTENLEKFMPEFIESYISWTDKELRLEQISKRTSTWIKAWSNDLGKIMKLNSHSEIECILDKGLKEGKGIAAFAREILDSGIRDEYYKARRVAVTEVLRAHSVAQQEAFMQSPAVTEKMWKHTGSYRNNPRQNHVDMDGERVLVRERFELDGIKGGKHKPMYPRDTILPPEESINCHCICQPVVSENIIGLPLEERQRLQQQALAEMDDEWEKELDAKNKEKAGIESDENEESKPKYDSQAAVINRKQIASAEYRKKYNALPEGKDIQRKVCADARKMLRHRSGTLYEDLTFIDSKTGESKSRTDFNVSRAVAPSKTMKRMIEKADDYTIISVHNHPHSSVPSINDLYCAKDRRYKYGIVACHDGTVYKYSVRGEINDPMVNNGLDLLEKTRYIENIEDHTKMLNSALKTLNDGGIEMEVLT